MIQKVEVVASDDVSASQAPHAVKQHATLGRIALVVAIATVIIVAWRLGAFEFLSLETLRTRRGELSAYVDSHRIVSFAIYMAIYATATAMALPGVMWITISGGFLFGLTLGTVGTTLGATSGALVLFLMARYLFAESLRARTGPFLKRFEDGFQRDAFFYLLGMRVMPIVPFFIANIAPAFLGVRASLFVLTTALGILPGVLAYAWIGAGLGAAFDAGQTPDLGTFAGELAPAFVALGLLSLAPALLRYFRARRIKNEVVGEDSRS